MKGEITLSSQEVQVMVSKHLHWMLSAANCQVSQIKSSGYSTYDPGLVVTFTDEPEEKEE